MSTLGGSSDAAYRLVRTLRRRYRRLTVGVDDYCKGAKNKSFSAYRRAIDREFCISGYLFEPGDQENEDIGQGTVLVSPLQLAVAYAALANGGTVFEPRVGQAIVSPTGQVVQTLKSFSSAALFTVSQLCTIRLKRSGSSATS